MAVNLTILMMIQCDSLRTASHQYYHEFGLSFAIKFGRHCPIVVLKMTTIFVIIFTYFSSFFDSTMIAMTWLRHTPRSRGLTLKVFSSFQNVVGCNCLGVFKSGHHQSVYQHCNFAAWCSICGGYDSKFVDRFFNKYRLFIVSANKQLDYIVTNQGFYFETYVP